MYLSFEKHSIYFYLFSGKEVTGIYTIEDKGLEKNLLHKIKNPEIEKGILLSKAWYQDYMNRVINRKLN